MKPLLLLANYSSSLEAKSYAIDDNASSDITEVLASHYGYV